jgi:hypothetical protein
MSTLSITADTPHTSSQAMEMDGGMLFWAGLSFSCASFVQYLVLSGHIALIHPAMMGLVWMGAAAAFVLFGFVLKIGSDRLLLQQPAVKRFRAVWGSLILGAAIVIAALMIMMVKFGLGANAAFIISPITLSVYGIGWRIAALMTGKSWPNLLSLGCFAGAIGLALLAGRPEQSLAYTACLTVFAVLPGLSLLLRQNAN